MLPAKVPTQLLSLDFDKAAELSKAELETYIVELEKVLLEYPQIEFPLEHYFANSNTEKGAYARELFIPKGSLLVGAIHKYQTINIVQGDCSVLSIDGVFRTGQKHTFVSSVGAKRVIYAHEDTFWTTIHATPETEPERIVEEFVVKKFGELGV